MKPIFLLSFLFNLTVLAGLSPGGLYAQVAGPSLSKQIAATNQAGSPETGDGSAGSERPVLIGEVVTYSLVFTVPEGTQSDVSIVDNLPAGLQYIGGSAIFTPTANTTLSYGTVVVADAALTFELGTVTNADSDPDAETLEIQYQARVLNTVGNQGGTLLSNGATLYFGVNPTATSESRTVQVTEPALQVTKEQRADYNGPFITGGDAGDEYVYTVRITNIGDAPAYDVKLIDFIPKDYVTQYGVMIFTGPDGFGFSYNGSTGEWNFQWTEIGVGVSRTATLRVRVKNTVRPLDSWDNTVDVTYTSLPGVDANERTGADGSGGVLNDYKSSATSTAFTVPEPAVALQVEHPSQTPVAGFFNGSYSDATSDPSTNTNQFTEDVDAAIGETFSYVLTVTFPEGTTAEFTMIDLASPNGHTQGKQFRVVDLLSAEVIHVGANLSNINNIGLLGTTFNIEDFFPTDGDGTRSQFWKGSPRDVLNTPDNIVNDDDRYVIRITARMDDEDESGGAADDVPVLENINGTVTGNRLQYQWRKSDNTQFTRNLVADVEIVEPVLALNKAVTATDGNGTISGGNLSNALPGDEVTFTLTLANNGTAPAYEVSLTDNFDAVFDLTSVSVTSGVDNSDLTNDVASVSIASIPAGGSVTVTAVALIRNSAAGGVTYTNTASASGKSQPGNGADIRAYSATGQASVSIIDCQVTISLVEVFAEVCPGANDGSIVVTAGTNTGHPLTYQISGPVAMSNNNGVFSNLPDGVYTVTVSNDGVIGCEATQMNVVVAPGVDNTPPMANCVSGVVTIQLDEFGAATLLATDLDAGSTDNCSQTLNFAFPDGSTQIAFDCGDVNTTSFLAIAVYDATGNQGACFSEVLVQDLLPPDAHCQDITISLGASGTATFSSNMIDNGSSDNCGSVNVQANNLILTCQDLGSFEATFTATDFAGNSSMCTATVTVVDDSPPVLSCQDITVGLDENGQAMLFSALLVVGVTENCGLVGDGSSVTPNMVTCAQAGQVVQVVVQEHDESGNPGTCTANVTVTDPLAPTFIDCPASQTFDSQDGQCGAFVEYSTPSATDNCNDPAVIQTAGISNPGFFPVGVTTQTYTATDAAGNSTVCSFTITIVDDEDPAIACPGDITVNNDAGLCSAVVSYASPTGLDNCPGASTTLTAGLGSGSVFPVGTTTEIYTVTDAAGNTASCSFDITVNDTEDPVISCPVSLLHDNDPGLCSANVLYDVTATDNCPGVTVALNSGLPSGSDFPVGVTISSYAATDAAGNTASCNVKIIVNDAENPTINCPADITVNNDPGSCGAVVSYPLPDGGDNCPVLSLAQTGGLGTGAVFPVGVTTETYTATDLAGNATSCSFTVTVNDGEAPTVSCPTDITVSNAIGQCSAVVEYILSVSDNCMVTEFVQTGGLVSGNAFPVGTTANSFTATDAAGNTAGCSFTVTVVDAEDPAIACPTDITVGNDAGQCGAAVIYTVTFGDNCPGETLSQTAGIGNGLLFPLGTTTNSFTVTDAAGNTASCSFTVTVNDTEGPTINCPADITVDNDLDQCGAIVNYAMGYGDNCPGATLVQTAGLAGGSFFPLGTTTNSFTVTDAVGQTASCSFTVTVEDGQAPDINCPADITVNNETDLCSAVVSFSVTASDNCPGAGTFIQTGGLWSGTAFPVGTTTNIFQVTDAAGNTSSCSFDVTVLDAQAPVVECNSGETMVALDGTGQGTLILDGQALQVWDNCASYAELIASAVAAQPNYDCSEVGQQSTTVTVSDGNGNSSSCVLSFAVVDFVAPDAQCQDATIQLNGNGVAGVTVGDIDAGSSDACGLQSLVLDEQNFNCYEVGANTVTLTVTDVNGNVASCTATVTVLDAAGPDDDCDGVSNVCDQCPGGDDSIDMNNDGLPDCAYPPPYQQIFGSWKCAYNKVYVCHNGITKCINKNALAIHIAHGDYLGPCNNAGCDELQAEGATIDPQGDVAWHEHERDAVLTAHPNPFLQEVTIGFWLPQEEMIRLEVYDLSGKLVRELQSGYAFAGEQEVIWNGRGPGGQLIEPGVYVLRLQTSQGVLTKQLILIR